MTQVKAQREAAGLTLTAVAQRTGMLCSKVWKIENGERRLTLVDAVKLAKAIGCEVLDFIDEEAPCPGTGPLPVSSS